MSQQSFQGRHHNANLSSGQLDLLKEDEESNLGRLFISSAFGEQHAGESPLMRGISSQLKDYLQEHGLQFQTVNYRWNTRDDALKQDEICLKKADFSYQHSSTIPRFLLLSFDDENFKSCWKKFSVAEFEGLMENTADEGSKTFLLSWYKRDENAIPAEYILQLDPTDHNGEDLDLTENELEEQQSRLHHILSSLETSTKLWHPERDTERSDLGSRVENTSSCCLIYVEDMELPKEITSHNSKHSLSKDPENKITLLQKWLARKSISFVTYMPDSHDIGAKDYSRKRSTENPATGPMVAVTSVMMGPPKKVSEGKYFASETDAHRQFGRSRVKTFYGRSLLLEQGLTYFINENSSRFPFVIHGINGAGKTSYISKLADEAQHLLSVEFGTSPALVIRLCGTTPQSCDTYSLVQSICQEIAMLYGRKRLSQPLKHDKLVNVFHRHLRMASKEKPLLLFIDALDQLNDEYWGPTNWKWLLDALPSNVFLIVSTLPDIGGYYRVLLEKNFPSENYLEVKSMSYEESFVILQRWFAAANRRLTSEQFDHILDASVDDTEEPATFLRLRLLFDISVKWYSYTSITYIPKTVEKLLEQFLDDLEMEHGNIFVSTLFGLLATSKRGLSVTDLLDILSCCDDVVAQKSSCNEPKKGRIPQDAIERLLYSLGEYTVERGVLGKSVLSWYHRPFRQAAKHRYLQDGCRRYATLLKQYFGGELHIIFPERNISSQPLYWKNPENDFVTFNAHKMSELPAAALKSQISMWVETILCDIKLIAAKIEGGLIRELVNDLMQAAKFFPSKRLDDYSSFMSSEFYILEENPKYFLQHAINYNGGSYVSKEALSFVKQASSMFPWDPFLQERSFFQHVNKESDEQACIMTEDDMDDTTDLKFWGNKYLFSTNRGTKIFVWDIRSCKHLRTVSLVDEIEAFELLDVVEPSARSDIDVIDVSCVCRDGRVYIWRLRIHGTVSVKLTCQWMLHRKMDTSTCLKFINNQIPLLATAISYFDEKEMMFRSQLHVWDISSPLEGRRNAPFIIQSKDDEELSLDGSKGVISSIHVIFDHKFLVLGHSNESNNGRVSVCSVSNLKLSWSSDHSWKFEHKIDVYEKNSELAYLLVSLKSEVGLLRLRCTNSEEISGALLQVFSTNNTPWIFGSSLNHIIAVNNEKLAVYKISGLEDREGKSEGEKYLQKIAVLNEEEILCGHEADIEVVAFHSHMVATASLDGVIKLWDLLKLGSTRDLIDHHSPIYFCRVMPENAGTLTCSEFPHSSSKVWNSETGDIINTYDSERRGRLMYSTSFSRVVSYDSSCYSDKVHLFGVDKVEYAKGLKIDLPLGIVNNATFSSDEKYVALEYSSGRLAIMSLESRTWTMLPLYYDGKIYSESTGVLFLDDGKTILVWGSSYQTHSEVSTAIFKYDLEKVFTQLCFLGDKHCCLKIMYEFFNHVCKKGFLRVKAGRWCSVRKIVSSRKEQLVYTAACVIPRTNLIAMATTNGLLQLRDITSFETQRERFAHKTTVNLLSAAKEGKCLVSICTQGWIRLWKVKNLLLMAEFYNEARISCLDFFIGPSRNLFLTFGDSIGQFKVLEVLSKRSYEEEEEAEEVFTDV